MMMRRRDARKIIRAALAAADPYKLVREAVSLRRMPLHKCYKPGMDLRKLVPPGGPYSPEIPVENIRIVSILFRPDFPKNLYVIGCGKAGAPMARAVEDALGDRITAGLIVVKDGYRTVKTSRIEIMEAAHPVPDERSCEAAGRLLELAEKAEDGDLVIFLLSGGGSALTALPAGNLTLADLQQTNQALLRSGAPIGEINAVRKHLTMASGGRLGVAAWPATVVTLIISDVIGDDIGTIASGPTYPDQTTFATALDVLKKRGLRGQVPAAVIAHLEAGRAGEVSETPKSGDHRIKHGSYYILGSNSVALEAAAKKAEALGYRVIRPAAPLTGEAREEAGILVARARKEVLRGGDARLPVCIIAGGETTVTVTGDGTGGRAQEFALAAALEIEGLKNTLVFAFGTDGTDGPTDAAGAFADGGTAERARALGLDPHRHLADNDAYHFFRKLDDLIITGPTGTNVNDIYAVIAG